MEEILILPVFGFLLEFTTIRAFQIYHYNPDWPSMFLGVPVTVALSWGNIVYASRLITDRIKLPIIQKSMLQALLATSLDLIMDPNSIRIGPMWMWKIPIKSQYFGIPWANYFGWLIAVFMFSLSFQVTSNSQHEKIKKYFVPLTLIISIIGVGSINGLYVTILPITDSYDWANIVVIGSVIVLFIFSIVSKSDGIIRGRTYLPLIIFGSFIVSYFVFGLIFGVFRSIPTFISIFIIISGIQLGINMKILKQNSVEVGND